MLPSDIALIILTVAFTSAAILSTYFLLGVRVEAQVIKTQTAFLIDSLLGGFTLPRAIQAPLRQYLQATKKDDGSIAAQNQKVVQQAVKAITLLCVTALAAAYLLAPYSLANNLKHAAAAGVLAACTEALFALTVAKHFYCADPNGIKLMVLRQLTTKI